MSHFSISSIGRYLIATISAGELRLQLPVPVDSYSGYYDATVFGPSCVAKTLEGAPVSSLPPETIAFLLKVAAFSPNNPSSEDCELLFSITLV